jgi:hypothetical protein
MDSVYFLHINKTAGRFLYDYVIKPSRFAIDLDYKFIIPKKSNSWTHWGWTDLIQDSTYIIASLRDPVEVAISYYLHSFGEDHDEELDSLKSGLKSKYSFFYAMERITNIQSKNFMTWKDDKVFVNTPMPINKNLVFERLDKVNLLLNSKDINIKTAESIQQKIFKDLNINSDTRVPEKDTNSFRTKGFNEFYNSFTQAQFDRIADLNSIDMELYEKAQTLFWKPEQN